MSTKLNELCIATLVCVVSDRFGIAPTSDDELTASGLVLRDDIDPIQITDWTSNLIGKFQWMFDAKTTIADEDSQRTAALVRAAFEGDECAEMQLRKIYAVLQ
jgi:hypothetical protein